MARFEVVDNNGVIVDGELFYRKKEHASDRISLSDRHIEFGLGALKLVGEIKDYKVIGHIKDSFHDEVGVK